MADLLAALAPRQASAVAPAAPASVGVIPLFLAAGKGVQAGIKWIQSPKGQKFLARLKDTEDQARKRQKLYQAKADRSKDPAVKARWQRRADRQQERLDDARITKMLAEKGIVEKGPVLEYKRNLLAMQWEGASPERQTEIETRIAQMDRRLQKLHQERTLLDQTLSPSPAPGPVPSPQAATKGSRRVGAAPVAREHQAMLDLGLRSSRQAQDRTPRDLESEVLHQAGEVMVPWGKAGRKLSSLPPIPRALVKADKMIVSGMGADRYAVQAPPGPGRLVRIPFYPANDVNSWSGTGGIDFKNDDPVAMLSIVNGVNGGRVARPLLLRTERFDYGSYRILGFQVNEQGNTKPVVAGPGQLTLGGIVITFRNLQLYNGQTLFLQEDQVWSASYNVFPGSYTVDNLGGTGNSARLKLPDFYERRRSRWFQGLRDYPVVTGTTFVSVEVGAYSAYPASGEDPIWQIPITCNVVAEMVEDKVFGDLINPSPASRGGATVKVAARETGTDWRGKPQVQIVSARQRRALTE